MSATVTVHVVTQPVHYVALASTAPLVPYSSWATAATRIQDAVDAATVPGALVLVSNGVYGVGGRVVFGAMSNRVAVTKPLIVQSVNGSGVTVIQGYQVPGTTNGDSAVRCVYMTNDATLIGFTLRSGATRAAGTSDLEQSGGGVWCPSVAAVVSNCVLIGNSAYYDGGGAYCGTLNNCTFAGNSAFKAAGGAYNGTLNNCTLTGSSAAYGGGTEYGTLNNCTLAGNSASTSAGGANYSTLNNCIVYYNTAPTNSNYYPWTLNYCCTFPWSVIAPGNFTNAPLFVDLAGGNLRLGTNSPCINAGCNAYVRGPTDLDGRPRIVGGTVDVGAYEFQPAVSGSFLGWLQRYGLPTDGSADYADSDHDGMNNWWEFCAGTIPTNSLSALRLVSVTHDASGLSVTWQSVTNQTYFLERSASLSGHPSFLTLATNIPGQHGTTTYTDTNAVGSGPFFYRVGVQTGGWQMASGGSIISYAWLQQYGLPIDGSADYADLDHDGMNNWQEWIAGTDPTNAASALRMLSATGTVSGVTVAWTSVTNRSYSLERATNLGAFPSFSLLRSNIAGLPGATSWSDTNAAGQAPRFYRVRVEQ